MNSKYLILIATMLLFSFCQKQANYTLSEEQLVEILADVHVAESVINKAGKELKDSMILLYMDQIYQIHKITEAEYIANLELLKKDPKKMSAIYEKILIYLKKEEVKNN